MILYDENKDTNIGSEDLEDSKKEKLLQNGQISEKYKTGVSLLTKETDNSPHFSSVQEQSSFVNTREDVFFHLLLAFNSLFFAKILTGWVKMDKFGYLSETNVNLWLNLGALILFSILVLVQLFQMKKYQSKFS